MASKTTFEMYEELMNQASLFGEDESYFNHSNPNPWNNDEDGEDFLTSEDMVKMEEARESKGISGPKGPVKIEEEVHFKRYSKRREHKYTEKELNEIKESCRSTIVHDYSEFDRYHISDEERAKNDSLAELSAKLGGLKRLYRKVDQYIEAMRVVVEAWEILEEKENYLHTKEEFFRMVADGRIYHAGIMMPKLKGIDKYNINMIIRYISNPELDPKDLLPIQNKTVDDWYDQFDEDYEEESEEEEMERLLSEEEVQYILDNTDNPPELEVHNIKPKYIRGYDQRNGINKKKFSKKERKYMEGLHDLLNKIQANPENREDGGDVYSRSWLITNSMFEPEKKEKDIWDSLYFNGSWTSKTDLFLYDLAVREEILNQKAPGERYQTNADKELQEFFRTMEQHGMNVIELRRKMNMSNEQLRATESKREKKNNKKIESALIQRITKLNGNEKFKKLVAKAEKAINEEMKEY